MMAFYQIVNVSNENVYNNQSEWNKLCKYDKWKTLESEDPYNKAKKWCKSNKAHCAAVMGTGVAMAFF